jgi:fructose-1,6-bisphosphatase/inositol monophosphatase family enzyme
MKILVCLSVHYGIVIGLSANGKFVVGIVGVLKRRELPVGSSSTGDMLSGLGECH